LLVIATKVEMVAEVDAGESMSREIDVAGRPPRRALYLPTGLSVV